MKLCCFFNHSPFYRFPIYRALSKSFDCDFFFNSCLRNGSVSFDVNSLEGFICRIPGIFIFKSKVVLSYNFRKLLNKKYTHFLLSGDVTFLLNWFILLWAKGHKKKVYFWTHGLKASPNSIFSKLFYGLFYKYADGIFLYGTSTLDNMLELGCRKERMHIIHNSLDTDIQTLLYSGLKPSEIYRNHFNNNYPTVIYIGRIQKRKRVDLLLRAIDLLNNQNNHVNLVIVGSAMDDDSIPALVESLGIADNVWLFGASYNEETNAELLYNAAVCVSPGNVGLTCIHTLSYGTPVVSHSSFEKQMPEYEAILEGVTGSFFRENDVPSLATEILKWTSITGEDRERIRYVARSTVLQDWSIDYQISEFKKAFCE